MVVASYHTHGAWNVEVASKVLEGLCTPALRLPSSVVTV